MGDIQDLLKRLDAEFFGTVFGLITIMVFLAGIQSLCFLFGAAPTLMEGLGYHFDVFFFSVTLLVILYELRKSPKLFPKNSGRKKGITCVTVALLAIVGIYVYVINPTDLSWIWLAVCFLMLLQSWILLERMKADTSILSLSLGAGLCYCIGAYFAMIFNDIEPAVELKDIIVISIATVCLWFRPCFD